MLISRRALGRVRIFDNGWAIPLEPRHA